MQLPWWHWGVAGGWAAFRTGGGRQDEEAEGGRGGREAGIRQPRPWQVGGLAGGCRHSGGSRGGGGGCSCGSLRIFLGLAQDGGCGTVHRESAGQVRGER